MMRLLSRGLALVSTLAVFACGKSKKDGSGSIDVKMTNNSGASLTAAAKPAYFGMKLVSIELYNDSSTGSSTIFVNPGCGTADSQHCGNDPAASVKLDKFFDFAQPTATVNAAINSQKSKVNTGSYTSLGMKFTRSPLPGDDLATILKESNNVEWKELSADAKATTETYETGAITVTLNPPLTVADGDSVTVNLAYTLAGAVVDALNSKGDCGTGKFTTPNAANRCLTLPTFTPSIVR